VERRILLFHMSTTSPYVIETFSPSLNIFNINKLSLSLYWYNVYLETTLSIIMGIVLADSTKFFFG